MSKLVNDMIAAMQAEIEKYGLELLQRYPSDLLVHDRNILTWAAMPGMEIAWMCGDSHTHIVPLGLHDKETDMVSCLLNMSRSDRFYLIKVRHEGFVLSEVTREEFAKLAKTPSKYRADGSKSGFWLKRRDLSSVGAIEITRDGHWQALRFKAQITPLVGISGADKTALNLWASHAIVEVAGSLFAKSEITWAEPLRLAA